MANYDKERSKELQPVGETYFVAEESERLEKLEDLKYPES